MNRKLKLGVVGLGQRGNGLIDTLLAIGNVEIVAVCDNYQDRIDKQVEKIYTKKQTKPIGYLDFNDLLKDNNVEATLICSSWESHIKQAIMSMKAHKITAMEVGGAYSVKECWDLVKAYEKYQTPFMMLENCCYDRFELLSTFLARDGKLGTIVHCHGAYSHDLRDEILGGNVNRHYRLNNYINRNAENYPTHELGPIAKILNINRGNKMVSMVSVASKSCGLEEFTRSSKNPDPSLVGQKFKQGDIVNTIITCENGETISMTLDTTLPKYYSREFIVRGTKGLTSQESNMVFLEDKTSSHEFFDTEKTIEKYFNNANEYNEYLPSYWRNITPEEKELGHGGMDYYMLCEFINHALNNEKMPIDVYDAASWAVITPLSEKSIKHNGKKVKIPDFTKGKYKNRKSEDVVKL